MTINIKLEGSKLTVIEPPVIAAGSANTVHFRLETDAEWNGLSITMVFRRVFAAGVDARSVIAVPGTMYPLPPEVLHAGWLFIGAKGVAQNGQVVLTTAKMEHPLQVNESEADAAASSGSITASMADQILALIGSVSNLDTVNKSTVVDAINEINTNVYQLSTRAVLSVNGKSPDKNGNVEVAAGGLQIVRAVHGSGDVYTATGDALPSVVPGSVGQHTGKGSQIVFIPGGENTTAAPKLQLNGGSKVQIRMRAPRNQWDNSQSPDATLPVPVGAMMNGVPYTMTFCGFYWLIDSFVHCPTFVVEMTKSSDGTITVDKTFAQIKSAYAAGQQIVCACYDESEQWDDRFLLPLESFYESGVAHFGRVIEVYQGIRELVTAYINSRSSGDVYGLDTWGIKDLPNIPTPKASDAGKTLTVDANGHYVLA